jgi:hypothetical protein
MHSRSIISVGGKTASNRVSFKSINREEVLKDIRKAKALKLKEGAISELERICMTLKEQLPLLVIEL